MIIPTVVSNSQKDLEKRIKKVSRYAKTLQLDVVDGQFANNKSFQFNFKLPKGLKYEAHLMVNQPEKWIEQHGKKVNKIIFHVEPVKNIPKIIKLIKSKRKKVGLALKPRTPVKKISRYLKQINQVTILTVNPGFYGSKFLPKPLEKIKQIKKINKKITVQVDGGMNPTTIPLAKRAGADTFCVGSYLQKSKDVKKSIKELKNALRN
ncbi:MAG: ribulose-phosphate 3-epimerase [Nanoarchaeota archaeon]|nr:ribulose-phosphate 3-epimerase [Nanoarchaeota archaeon]